MRDPADDFTPMEAEFVKRVRDAEDYLQRIRRTPRWVRRAVCFIAGCKHDSFKRSWWNRHIGCEPDSCCVRCGATSMNRQYQAGSWRWRDGLL